MHWAVEMDKKCVSASTLKRTHKLTYLKLAADLFQWLLMENVSLDNRQYEKSVAIPFPPALDGKAKCNYGTAIINLMLENMQSFLQCVNKGRDDCQVWRGTNKNTRRVRKAKGEKRSRTRSERNKKGKKIRKNKKEKKRGNRRNKQRVGTDGRRNRNNRGQRKRNKGKRQKKGQNRNKKQQQRSQG